MLCRNWYPLMSKPHFSGYKQSCYGAVLMSVWFWVLGRVAAAIWVFWHCAGHSTADLCWEWWVQHPCRCKEPVVSWMEGKFKSQSRSRFLPCSSFCHWFFPPCHEKRDALGIFCPSLNCARLSFHLIMPQTLIQANILCFGKPHLSSSVLNLGVWCKMVL